MPLLGLYTLSGRCTVPRWEGLAQVGSTQTVRLELGLLSHVFTIAIKEWGMEGLRNPVASIRLPKPPLGRDRRIHAGREVEPDELEAIIASTSSTQLPAIIRLAVETAMRRSEIIRLTWDQVDLNRRMVMLHQTKNGDRRIVPLTTRAVEIFRGIPESPRDLRRLLNLRRWSHEQIEPFFP